MKPSEAIREARNQLFERGWTQGAIRNEQGNVCSLGALTHAIRGVNFADILNVYELCRRYLHQAMSPPHWGIPTWNDEPSRTFDEVVEAFDKAEKLAEAAGQ